MHFGAKLRLRLKIMTTQSALLRGLVASWGFESLTPCQGLEPSSTELAKLAYARRARSQTILLSFKQFAKRLLNCIGNILQDRGSNPRGRATTDTTLRLSSNGRALVIQTQRRCLNVVDVSDTATVPITWTRNPRTETYRGGTLRLPWVPPRL